VGITGRNHKPNQCSLFDGPPLRYGRQQIAYHSRKVHKFPIKKEEPENFTIVNPANFPGSKKPGDFFLKSEKGFCSICWS
jgi:hypothetical protein